MTFSKPMLKNWLFHVVFTHLFCYYSTCYYKVYGVSTCTNFVAIAERQPWCQVVCPGDTLFQGSIGRTNWAGIPSLQGTSDARLQTLQGTSEITTDSHQASKFCSFSVEIFTLVGWQTTMDTNSFLRFDWHT